MYTKRVIGTMVPGTRCMLHYEQLVAQKSKRIAPKGVGTYQHLVPRQPPVGLLRFWTAYLGFCCCAHLFVWCSCFFCTCCCLRVHYTSNWYQGTRCVHHEQLVRGIYNDPPLRTHLPTLLLLSHVTTYVLGECTVADYCCTNGTQR